MGKEQLIQKKILVFLKANNAYTVKVESASRAGVPDIICCYKGAFIGIEVKTPETINNVSILQAINISNINKADGYAIVACDIEQVSVLLKIIDKATNDSSSTSK